MKKLRSQNSTTVGSDSTDKGIENTSFNGAHNKAERRSIIKRPSKTKTGFFGIVEIVVTVAIMVISIRTFMFQTYEVHGTSMSPTLAEQDKLIVFKFGKNVANVFGEYSPKRGEIVVFDSPRDSGLQLVKRVLGLPGERVVISSGEVSIYNDDNPQGFNPDLELEDTLNTPKTGNVDIVVPEGEIFVAGDNRAPGKSLDSRNDLGTVPIDNVVGDLIFRHIPLDDARTF